MLERVPAIAQPLLERLEIELALLDAQQITGGTSEQSRLVGGGGQRLAQARDLHVEHSFGRLGRLIAHQLIHQTGAGHDSVGVAQQQR